MLYWVAQKQRIAFQAVLNPKLTGHLDQLVSIQHISTEYRPSILKLGSSELD